MSASPDRAVTRAQGYAIGSAALVSLALFGAYVTRAEITTKDSSILAPEVCGMEVSWAVTGSRAA